MAGQQGSYLRLALGWRASFFRSSVPWFAELAQLVEQRFRKAWVAGSIPVLGSTGYGGG